MRITNLRPDDGSTIRKVAALLVMHDPDGTEWSDMEAALAWVEECFGAHRINRVAVDETSAVLGWYCACWNNTEKLWQQQRSVVAANRNITAAFATDLEEQARERGRPPMEDIPQLTHRPHEYRATAEEITRLQGFIERLRRVNPE